NVVTVTGKDDEQTSTQAESQHTIHFGNVAPVITIDKVGPGTINEGQTATYSFTITNGSVSTDTVTITSVVDDKLGDLTAAAIAANNGNPIVLAPGASFTFSAATAAALNAGSVTNVVTVTGHDDEGTEDTGTDTDTV